MKALALGVLFFVSLVRPNGERVPSGIIRELGGKPYVEMVTSLVWRAAGEEGVSPYDLAALLIEESTLRSYAVSSRRCKTIGQLHPGGKYYVAYRNACRAVPSECLYAAIRVSALALHEAQDECGNGPQGFGRYRSRHCLYRDREFGTWEKARLLQLFEGPPDTEEDFDHFGLAQF